MSGKMTTFIFTKYGIRHTVGYKAQIDDAAKMLRKEYGNVKILFAKYLEL